MILIGRMGGLVLLGRGVRRGRRRRGREGREERETHPVCARDAGIVHPEPVWNETWLGDWSLTPSTMSISPLFGQSGPLDQNAGHVPHPVGM